MPPLLLEPFARVRWSAALFLLLLCAEAVSSTVYADAVVVHMDTDARWCSLCVCHLQDCFAFWCDGSNQFCSFCCLELVLLEAGAV
ncbi:hypothetical protein Nepgr_022884 [Nepenthes gracilis]|uniref:Secreted protein n=1 Tax=Nepenthes gracilis TaxID=150966 RepID=A0AAD3XX78_NEPGR|nr:hypothetical protein Nepgr_022884 [Nepenthes gracilis]